MTFTRGIVAAAILAGLAIGTASPAGADPQEKPTKQMSGHYIETTTTPSTGQSSTNDWQFTPCGDGCASGASGTATGQARLANGPWTMDLTEDWICPDGSRNPGALSTHYTWDSTTLAGTVDNTTKVPACGYSAGGHWTNNIQFKQAP